MADEYKNLVSWFKLWSSANVQAEVIEHDRDNYDNDQGKQVAAQIIKSTGKEKGKDESAYISTFLERADIDDVEKNVKEGRNRYGKRLETLLNTQFDALYNDTDDDVKKGIYEDAKRHKPKSGLTGKFADIAKANETTHKYSELLQKIEGDDVPASERKDAKDKLVKEIKDEYDKEYPEPEYVDFLINTKDFFDKNPIIAINFAKQRLQKANEEYEKLDIADLKEYLQTAFDYNDLRGLYALTAIQTDKRKSDELKRKASGIQV